MHCEVPCQQDFMTFWKNDLTLRTDHYPATEHVRSNLGTTTAAVRKPLNGIGSIAYPPRVDVPKPESGWMSCRQTPKIHGIAQTHEEKVVSEALHM